MIEKVREVMKQRTKAGIALLLALCLVLSLAACGGGGTTDTGPNTGIGGEEGTLLQEGYVFVPEFIDLNIPGAGVQLVGAFGETLYLQYEVEVLGEDGMVTGFHPELAIIQVDGAGLTPFWTGRVETWTEGDRVYHSGETISATAARPGGGILMVRQDYSSFSAEDEWDFEETQILVAFTADGTLEREVSLTDLLNLTPDTAFGVSRIQEMSDGRVLMGTWDTLYVLSHDWTAIEQTIPWEMLSFLVTKNDEVLVSVWDIETGQAAAWFFDLETGAVLDDGDPVFAADIQNAQVGAAYDLYVGAQTAVFGFDLAAGRSTQLFDWMDVGMLNPMPFVVSGAGDIFFFEGQWGNPAGGPISMVRLVKRDAADVPARTEIIYGGLEIDFAIRQEIVEFNRRSMEYQIRIREYMDWMTMDQNEAIADAVRRLNADIITGNAPDILDFGQSLSFEQYARRGFLTPLNAFLDADSEIGPGDLVEPVMDLLAIDGTLYTITPQFNIQTLIGRRELVGPDMGWTMQEFLAAVDALPEGAAAFESYVTRGQFINSVLGVNLGLFVDRETGQANFDSPLFMDYLAFAQTLPEEPDLGDTPGGLPGDWTRPAPLAGAVAMRSPVDISPPIAELPEDIWDSAYARGQVMLAEQTLWSFNDIIFAELQFGGPITFKGYPSEHGIGSVVVPRSLIGISAASQNQDAAWSFVRTLLTERWQREYAFGFATNRTILEARIAEAMEGQPGGVDPEMGEFAGMEGATRAQIDQVMALIDQTDLLAMRDMTVILMIQEELLPFFAGDRSIEETVRIIQGRVQTYLNERG